MSLAAGARLGAYEIVGLIGAGGMGEVYRARDTRLNRTVAIKILQDKIAADPEFQERFRREAHAISSLEHPGICALYDVGEHDGISFIVMQYLEGETLEARLHKGALPVEAAMQHAIEIADALDKAHHLGIIHRDLKPGNIILTKSGAKLLDFGLAKTATPIVVSPSSTLPTRQANLTTAGAILGTLSYMAPEQFEGGTVDTRTDIFAFGAIVYEMLTGRKAFEGKSQASVIAAILDHEPPPASSDRPAVPRFLDHVVRRCLAKNPDARWQSARDLCDELQWVAREQEQPGKPSAIGRAGWRPRPREAVAWTIATLAMVAAVAAAAFYSRAPEQPREMRFDIAAPAADLGQFALSPDGTQLVAAVSTGGPRQLWIRSLESGSWRQLEGTEGADLPFWSPDNRQIGFFAVSKLKVIDIKGGVPRILAEASPRGGAWNADDVIVFAPNVLGPLSRMSARSGETTTITKQQPQSFHSRPRFLPGGRRFIYRVAGPPDIRGIYLGSLDSPETRRLTAADNDGSCDYVTPGWLLFIRDGALRAQRFDVERGELTGDDMVVANPVTVVSTSAAGLIAFRGGANRRTQLVWADRSGKTLGDFGPRSDSNMSAPRLSPVARRVAAFTAADITAGDIVLVDETRITRFTFDRAVDRFPIWSRDGQSVVFDSTRLKGRHLFVSKSPGAENLLLETSQDKTANDWSPDDRNILFQSNDPETGIDLWVWPLDGKRSPYVWLRTAFNERRASFSPDGRWVTYLSNESGRYDVYVRPFAPAANVGASGAQSLVSTTGGIQPRWNPNGRELHYIGPDGNLMTVPIKVTGDTLQAGSPSPLFRPRVVGDDNVDPGLQYDIDQDGRFLLNTLGSDTSPITVIVHWTPGLPD